MIEGATVSMGGKEWVVPPLSLAQLTVFLPRVQELQIANKQLQALVEIVAAALQRNYPEVTPEQVENILDLGNVSPVLNAILGNFRFPQAQAQPAAVEVGTGEIGHSYAGQLRADGLPDPFPGMGPHTAAPEAPLAAAPTVPPPGPAPAPYETATQWPHLPGARS